MRWGRPIFALFAVFAIAMSVFGATSRAGAADPTVETTVGLFWRDQPDRQPDGNSPIRFFVAVIADSGSARPTGTVSVLFDGKNENLKDLPLKAVPDNDALARSACGQDDVGRCSITNDFTIVLGFSAHFFRTDFSGDDTFKATREDLGFARGTLSDDPRDNSKAGQNVTYSFQLTIWKGTPTDRRPTGTVDYSDDQNHSAPGRTLDSDLKASPWVVAQDPPGATVTANYPGDDVYLPVRVSKLHGVSGPDPTPGATTPPPTAPARTTTTRRSLGRSTPTTAALAPINPNPATTIPGETTTTGAAFGDFVTSVPPATNNVTAAGNPNDDEGPPIAVVATTLLALAGLGGVAAFRRYRRGGAGADWF